MEGVLTEFGSLIQGLQAGRFDVITAGNPLDLHSYEDIAANPDITVGGELLTIFVVVRQ